MEEELRQMKLRTRKQMTMHKILPSRDDIDRLFVSRKEGESRLSSTEDVIDALLQGLEENIEKRRKKG